MAMQSAFERAMQKLGGEIREFTPEQKDGLAEIDRRADAKIAEIRMRTEARLASAEPAEQEQLRHDMAVEIEGLNQHRERQKEALKEQFAKDNAQSAGR